MLIPDAMERYACPRANNISNQPTRPIGARGMELLRAFDEVKVNSTVALKVDFGGVPPGGRCSAGVHPGWECPHAAMDTVAAWRQPMKAHELLLPVVTLVSFLYQEMLK